MLRLERRETHKTWDADFRTQQAGEDPTLFVRTNADDPALLAFGQRLSSWMNLVANPPRITVNVKPDLTAILVHCPEQDCTIIDLGNGVQMGSRSLMKGQVVALPLGAEVIIHPVSSRLFHRFREVSGRVFCSLSKLTRVMGLTDKPSGGDEMKTKQPAKTKQSTNAKGGSNSPKSATAKGATRSGGSMPWPVTQSEASHPRRESSWSCCVANKARRPLILSR